MYSLTWPFVVCYSCIYIVSTYLISFFFFFSFFWLLTDLGCLLKRSKSEKVNYFARVSVLNSQV